MAFEAAQNADSPSQKAGRLVSIQLLSVFSITGYRAFREEHGVGNPINPCPIIILI